MTVNGYEQSDKVRLGFKKWFRFIPIFVDFESESKDFALDFRELAELEYAGFAR